MPRFSLLLVVLLFSRFLAAQENDFALLAQKPKDTSVYFPIDHKISRPRLVYPDWDKDFDLYYRFLTPAIRKTQASISYREGEVVTTVTPNSIIPHAQLDTSTMIYNPEMLEGTWRMIKFRSVRFNDSVWIPTKTYYRLADTLLADNSTDDGFAVFTDNNFKLYVKETGETEFKKVMSAKYKIENRRFMLVYKLSRAAGGVSQFGIDEKGFLVLNYPRVIENVKKGEYFSYYAVIEQYIFEKVK
ncbi:MAG: hypothetical protein JNM88_00095 [Chitinophagaceae bacterium]|nr:hypothetical protein [Chitinophagaceae bacterium]